MRIPVLQTSTVLHIGTLDPALAGRNNYEGHCLAVSLCPLAWRRIAKLGGLPLWQLACDKGLYLDLLAAGREKSLRRLIEDWAVSAGYGTRAQIWRAWSTDEDGALVYSTHATEALAREEAGEDLFFPNGSAVPSVESERVLTGTRRLIEHVRVTDLGACDAFDYVAIVWAEATQPALTGVWWQEQYAPERLSAPRGGIFPDRLGRFKASQCSSAAWMDDEEETALHPARLPFDPQP